MNRGPVVRLLAVVIGLCVLVSIVPGSVAAVSRFSQDAASPDALETLGGTHIVRGEYLLAIPLLRRACALRAEHQHDNGAVANCLEALARALIYTSQFTEAQGVLKRAQATQEADHVARPLGRSRTLALVAVVQRSLGHYESSRATLDQAMSLRQGHEIDSDDRVMLVLLRGDLFWLSGDILSAHREYETAAALPHSSAREAIDHLVALRRRAVTEAQLGRITLAMASMEQAEQAGAELLAECHDERAGLLHDRAAIARYQGDFFTGKDLYEKALALLTRCAPINGMDAVTTILNLASAAESIGDTAEAEKLYDRVAQEWSSRYNPSHPFVALAVDGLARVALTQGDLQQAKQRSLRALNIRRRSLGEDHPDVAWTSTNLAQIDFRISNIPSATTYLGRSARIYERAGVSDQPDRFAQFLTASGELQLRLGNPSRAKDFMAQALASRLQSFGDAHPLSAEARADLARAQALDGREDLALESALAAEDVAKNHLRRSISYLPERQALMYAGVRPEGLNLAVSIAAVSQQSKKVVFDAVIRSRAVVLDELGSRGQFRSASDPNLSRLREDLGAARQRLANLSLRSVRERVPTPAAILEEAQRDAEAAERALAERSAAFRLEQARAESGFDDVWRALPADAVLVSYLKYQHTALPKQGQTLKVVSPTESYIAFVATAQDGAVAAVPLGPARVVEATIADWRTAMSASAPNEVEYRKVGGALRRQIWDPIAKFVKGTSLVFIVPDGAINLVSFGALPVGNTYLLENVQGVHYLSAERDLLSNSESTTRGGLLAIGGVDFVNQPIAARGSARAAPSPVAKNRSVSMLCSEALSRFEALPGTNGEVADIGAIWNKNESSGRSAMVLRGSLATEQAFKREASGRAILHLATHGFFLDGQCQRAPGGTRAVGGLVAAHPVAEAPTQTVERRFALSGLALAGANDGPAAKSGDDDGILTAEEVLSLNLEGVEWAVLSACDTGLGRIRAGEGVFGLRRAFQIAGVRTVIMSLWAVEDEATRLWMRSLYEGRLVRRLSTSRAVRDASIAVLADRRAKGLSAHPFYWAGFVAAGSWR